MNRLAAMTWSDAKVGPRDGVAGDPRDRQHRTARSALALETDTAIAWALGQRLVDDLADAAVLLPRIDYGLSEHHLAFPGTITLRPETYLRLLLDIIESLATWDMRRILIVNGHGGNIDALRLVSRTALRDQAALVASVMWARIASDEIAARVHSDQLRARLRKRDIGGHGRGASGRLSPIASRHLLHGGRPTR